MIPQAFYILLGASLTVVTCIALGKLLLRGLSLRFFRGEEEVLSFIVGSSCLSLLVFLITAAGVARKGVFVGLAAISLVTAVWRRVHHRAAASLPALSGMGAKCGLRFLNRGMYFGIRFPNGFEGVWQPLFLIVFAAFTLLYFFNAMAPETSPDGMAYHLGLVHRYLKEQHFPRITTNMYASLSQGVEMLFLFAFSIGRHSAAALVHFAFLFMLPLAMLFYGRRFGFPVVGLVGALFVYCAPVVGRDGTCAYNDVATACVLFGVFYLLQIWDKERTPALLVPIGLLAGFAYATKYTAFVAVPYALAVVAWKLRRSHRPLIRPLLIVGVCALLMMAPWMLKNWITVQNPFSPFFNSLFPNPHVHISFEESYRDGMRQDARLKGWWEIPWEVTLDGRFLVGVLGPLFLLAPLALLALRNRQGRQLLLSAAVFGLTYATNIQTRFLIPALPFLALAMAMVLARWRYLTAILLLAHAVSSWPPALRTYIGSGAWRLPDEIPIRQALRLENEDSYLMRTCSGYVLARMIEDSVPPGKRVLSFNQVPEAYTSKDILVGYTGAFNSEMVDVIRTAMDTGLQPTRLLKFHFSPRSLRAIRVVQTAEGEDLWSIGELRVFRGDEQLPRLPQWQLHANAFPWDIELAFDRNPVTRWRSWQHLFNGMFVEVDFGKEETVDAVLLECSYDQWGARLKIEGRPPSGEWTTLAGAPRASDGPPVHGLRQLANQTLKSHGVDFLLVSTHDFPAKDLFERQREWNVTPVGMADGNTLYRLD